MLAGRKMTQHFLKKIKFFSVSAPVTKYRGAYEAPAEE